MDEKPDFHTITSILKQAYTKEKGKEPRNFHTITSILKQTLKGLNGGADERFPYDYVYFKARDIEGIPDGLINDFHTITSILKLADPWCH